MTYSALFEAAGKFVKLVNFLTMLSEQNLEFENVSGDYKFTSLDKFRSEFAEKLNQSFAEREGMQILTSLNNFKNYVKSFKYEVLSHFEAYLSSTWADELELNSNNVPDILAKMKAKMCQDSQSIEKNTVSVGTITPDTNNAGTGSVAVFKKSVLADGTIVDDERIKSQQVELVCSLDSPHDSRASGNEQFMLKSEQANPVSIPVISATSGSSADAYFRNRLKDGCFAEYDSGFTFWQIASGNSLFSQEISTTYIGDSALKINGSGAESGEIQQELDDLNPALKPSEFYAIAANVYVSAITAGTVKIKLAGDNYVSDEEIEINSNTNTGSWLKLSVLELLPKVLPENLVLKIEVSADFNGTIFLDNLALAQPTFIDELGIAIGIFQGNQDFISGTLPDKFSFSLTSDEAGIFQKFFRDYYNKALVSSDSETISDNYAK